MDIVLDEDIPCSFREIFEELGFKVIDIHDTPLRGFPDEKIFKFAQKEQAILVTADKDFLYFVSVLKRPHHGLVIIRFPSSLSLEERKKRLGILLQTISKEDLIGNITVIQPGTLRIRRKKFYSPSEPPSTTKASDRATRKSSTPTAPNPSNHLNNFQFLIFNKFSMFQFSIYGNKQVCFSQARNQNF